MTTVSFSPKEIDSFLYHHGWGQAEVVPMQADFSSRHFYRLIMPQGDQAILMRSGEGQNGEMFVLLAQILKACHVRAPHIYASDLKKDEAGKEKAAIILMEYLGAKTIGQLIDQEKPSRETLLSNYRSATRILIQIHQSITPDLLKNKKLPLYDTHLFITQLSPFLDTFCSGLSSEAKKDFIKIWRTLLCEQETLPRTLLLRDYMLDNLMQPAEEGADLGLIDFQDAGVGCLSYDLASLIEQVRRDLPPDLSWDDLATEVLSTYHAARPELDYDHLKRSVIVFSAQRHMRTLGRLESLGKEIYIPRVQSFLTKLLAKEPLDPLRQWIQNYLPDFFTR